MTVNLQQNIIFVVEKSTKGKWTGGLEAQQKTEILPVPSHGIEPKSPDHVVPVTFVSI